MSDPGAAPRAAVSSARAEASRSNGARARGPRTPEGKARSSRNALKHGLRAARHVVLPDEDAAACAALEAALFDDLAPVGALQTVLARQIVAAAWRLARADRIEAEILIFRQRDDADLGLAVTRDANTARALPTLLRYRGAAQAELLRALRTLQALQAGQTKTARAPESAAVLAFAPKSRRAGTAAAPDPRAGAGVPRREPHEPERGAPRPDHVPPEPRAPARALHEAAAPWRPNEPERSGDGGGSAPSAPAARRDQPPGATRA